MSFQSINIRQTRHPAALLADEWALLSAGTPERWNAMTVNWGGVGELWGFSAALVFVRPQRYTFEFMQENECFTLSFGLPKETTNLCGEISGRDCDKIARAGLAAHSEGAAIWPATAKLVLVCRKVFAQDMNSAGFVDPNLAQQHYPEKDYHRMFVGEIMRVYQRRQSRPISSHVR